MELDIADIDQSLSAALTHTNLIVIFAAVTLTLSILSCITVCMAVAAGAK